MEVLKFARKSQLNVVGIYFNLQYECKNVELFQKSFQFAKQIFEYGKTIGYNFKLLHVGK